MSLRLGSTAAASTVSTTTSPTSDTTGTTSTAWTPVQHQRVRAICVDMSGAYGSTDSASAPTLVERGI